MVESSSIDVNLSLRQALSTLKTQSVVKLTHMHVYVYISHHFQLLRGFSALLSSVVLVIEMLLPDVGASSNAIQMW
jgi:ABC-type protease/lipase transport system fused ATPase/permease subunit